MEGQEREAGEAHNKEVRNDNKRRTTMVVVIITNVRDCAFTAPISWIVNFWGQTRAHRRT